MEFLRRFLLTLAILSGLGFLIIIFFPEVTGLANNQLFIIFGLMILSLFVDPLITLIKKGTGKLEYPYVLRDDFLSPAEHSFYLVLKQAVSDWALVCPKVRLGDLFYVNTRDRSKKMTYRNKIDRKHVDFLLCNPKTAKPILGIELDDKSHMRRDRQERDDFVDKAFAAANLPLARISVKISYSTSELDALLRQYTQSQ
jgi:hypothetical protein